MKPMPRKYLQKILSRRKVLTLVLILSASLMIHCGKKTVHYEALKGTWVSDDERYADRTIEIGEGMLSFGTGTGIPNMYFIQHVDHGEKGPTRRYTLFCSDTEGNDFRFVLYLENGSGGLILRLNHPHQVIWYKIDPRSKQ